MEGRGGRGVGWLIETSDLLREGVIMGTYRVAWQRLPGHETKYICKLLPSLGAKYGKGEEEKIGEKKSHNLSPFPQYSSEDFRSQST